MSPLADEDARDVAAFRAGRREAFGAIYDRHQARVYALAWRMLRDPSLALDTSQGAFLALLSRLQDWEPRVPLGAFLAEAAWREARTLARRRLPAMAAEPEAPTPPPAPGEREEEARLLWEAVGELAVRDRQAVLLHYSQRLEIGETADVMGITSSAVRSHLARAMAVLRKKIGERD